MYLIIIQSSNNFANDMTAELSWHLQNFEVIGLLEFKLKQKNHRKISLLCC